MVWVHWMHRILGYSEAKERYDDGCSLKLPRPEPEGMSYESGRRAKGRFTCALRRPGESCKAPEWNRVVTEMMEWWAVCDNAARVSRYISSYVAVRCSSEDLAKLVTSFRLENLTRTRLPVGPNSKFNPMVSTIVGNPAQFSFV